MSSARVRKTGSWLSWYFSQIALTDSASMRACAGDVVLLHRPDRRELLVVKRVRNRLGDGRLWLEGDNPLASDDSRLFGPVGPEEIVGRVVWRYRPLRRRRAGMVEKD